MYIVHACLYVNPGKWQLKPASPRQMENLSLYDVKKKKFAYVCTQLKTLSSLLKLKEKHSKTIVHHTTWYTCILVEKGLDVT